VDRNYLVSTLRQHLLASGCALRAERDQAEFIVEARAGAIGTDRNDLLFGVPSMNVPQIMPVQPVAAAIPEVPLAKRRDQRGIAKIAVFAYHRETGMPVWQSGIAHQESSANDVWILGAGPFQRGTIYDGTAFAGNAIRGDDAPVHERISRQPSMDLARERLFSSPQQLAKQPPTELVEPGVVPAVHAEPLSTAARTASNPVQPQSTPPNSDSTNHPRGPITAQTHNGATSHTAGSFEPAADFPRPTNPVPLPMPQFNVPQP
jgi:hypothetical protein